MGSSGLLDWAATYLVHSTAMLGGVAIASRWISSQVWQETLWKGAIVGSVLTATMVAAVPFRPLGGRFGSTGASATVAARPSAAGPAQARDLREAPSAAEDPPGSNPATRGTSQTVVLAWLLTSAVLLARLARAHRRFLLRLGPREPVGEGSIHEILGDLRIRAGVRRPLRLTRSRYCPVPLVLGREEVCVPTRFLEDLEPPEQRAALAHEVAHLRRHDPEWRLAAAVLQGLFFFQPLQILARRRLCETAEYRCDDWAVREVGSAVALARTLTRIAGWMPPSGLHRHALTPAATRGGFVLVRRMQRIARQAHAVPEPARSVRAAALVALVLVLGVTAPAIGGSVTVGRTEPSTPRGGPLTAVSLLERRARTDPDGRSRQEATARLSDHSHPAAAAALIRLARHATDPVVRAEAAQQLDEFPTDPVVGALLEVVMNDPAVDPRDNALDVLDDLDLASATAALRRIAREHRDPAVRDKALDALSDGS